MLFTMIFKDSTKINIKVKGEKPQGKTAREIACPVFLKDERATMFNFIVEGGKADFCDS